MISSNSKIFNKICKQLGLVTLGIFAFPVMGMWSLACEYIIYEKDEFFGNIIFGFLSWILNLYACAFVILISWFPLVCSRVLDSDDRRIKLKDFTICQVVGCIFSIIILSCVYFTYFYVEKFTLKNNISSNPFDSNAYKYVLCGFLKTFPSFCVLIYSIYHEKNSKVMDIEKSDDKV